MKRAALREHFAKQHGCQWDASTDQQVIEGHAMLHQWANRPQDSNHALDDYSTEVRERPLVAHDDHLHCNECSPNHGIHCAYHCSLFLTEVIRVMGEQDLPQREAEDVVIKRLREKGAQHG